MSLDVYVGSLTRYFLRTWETEAQRWAREEGLTDQLVPPPDPIPAQEPLAVQRLVETWRTGIAAELADKVQCALDWDESEHAPYFTGRPSWACYGHLLLWAAYDEYPQASRPPGPVKHWEQDPLYLRAAAGSKRYPQLLRGAVWWLPCDYDWMFLAEDPGGHERGIGSSVKLLAELEALNQRTWKLGDAELAQLRAGGTPRHGADLETGARFSLALCTELARLSVKHHLPYLLDF